VPGNPKKEEKGIQTDTQLPQIPLAGDLQGTQIFGDVVYVFVLFSLMFRLLASQMEAWIAPTTFCIILIFHILYCTV
jgi:hypothetical protein